MPLIEVCKKGDPTGARVDADIAIGRLGARSEVTLVILDPSYEHASYVTGELVVVDGGRRAKP